MKWSWGWLWWGIPAFLGAVWWLICIRKEAKRKCIWCGAEDPEPHSRSCRAEMRKP